MCVLQVPCAHSLLSSALRLSVFQKTSFTADPVVGHMAVPLPAFLATAQRCTCTNLPPLTVYATRSLCLVSPAIWGTGSAHGMFMQQTTMEGSADVWCPVFSPNHDFPPHPFCTWRLEADQLRVASEQSAPAALQSFNIAPWVLAPAGTDTEPTLTAAASSACHEAAASVLDPASAAGQQRGTRGSGMQVVAWMRLRVSLAASCIADKAAFVSDTLHADHQAMRDSEQARARLPRSVHAGPMDICGGDAMPPLSPSANPYRAPSATGKAERKALRNAVRMLRSTERLRCEAIGTPHTRALGTAARVSEPRGPTFGDTPEFRAATLRRCHQAVCVRSGSTACHATGAGCSPPLPGACLVAKAIACVEASALFCGRLVFTKPRGMVGVRSNNAVLPSIALLCLVAWTTVLASDTIALPPSYLGWLCFRQPSILRSCVNVLVTTLWFVHVLLVWPIHVLLHDLPWLLPRIIVGGGFAISASNVLGLSGMLPAVWPLRHRRVAQARAGTWLGSGVHTEARVGSGSCADEAVTARELTEKAHMAWGGLAALSDQAQGPGHVSNILLELQLDLIVALVSWSRRPFTGVSPTHDVWAGEASLSLLVTSCGRVLPSLCALIQDAPEWYVRVASAARVVHSSHPSTLNVSHPYQGD